jgi:hypothetical protein
MDIAVNNVPERIEILGRTIGQIGRDRMNHRSQMVNRDGTANFRDLN